MHKNVNHIQGLINQHKKQEIFRFLSNQGIFSIKMHGTVS